MSMTARHLAKRAPRPWYSASRSRRPSRPFGDGLAREAGERLRARVHLDAREDAARGEQLREWLAVGGLLAEGLVVQDHAGNVLLGTGRGEQQLAVGAARLEARLEPDLVEALLDRAGGFVSRQDALSGGDHRLRVAVQCLDVHRLSTLRIQGAKDTRALPPPTAGGLIVLKSSCLMGLPETHRCCASAA